MPFITAHNLPVRNNGIPKTVSPQRTGELIQDIKNNNGAPLARIACHASEVFSPHHQNLRARLMEGAINASGWSPAKGTGPSTPSTSAEKLFEGVARDGRELGPKVINFLTVAGAVREGLLHIKKGDPSQSALVAKHVQDLDASVNDVIVKTLKCERPWGTYLGDKKSEKSARAITAGLGIVQACRGAFGSDVLLKAILDGPVLESIMGAVHERLPAVFQYWQKHPEKVDIDDVLCRHFTSGLTTVMNGMGMNQSVDYFRASILSMLKSPAYVLPEVRRAPGQAAAPPPFVPDPLAWNSDLDDREKYAIATNHPFVLPIVINAGCGGGAGGAASATAGATGAAGAAGAPGPAGPAGPAGASFNLNGFPGLFGDLSGVLKKVINIGLEKRDAEVDSLRARVRDLEAKFAGLAKAGGDAPAHAEAKLRAVAHPETGRTSQQELPGRGAADDVVENEHVPPMKPSAGPTIRHAPPLISADLVRQAVTDAVQETARTHDAVVITRDSDMHPDDGEAFNPFDMSVLMKIPRPSVDGVGASSPESLPDRTARGSTDSGRSSMTDGSFKPSSARSSVSGAPGYGQPASASSDDDAGVARALAFASRMPGQRGHDTADEGEWVRYVNALNAEGRSRYSAAPASGASPRDVAKFVTEETGVTRSPPRDTFVLDLESPPMVDHYPVDASKEKFQTLRAHFEKGREGSTHRPSVASTVFATSPIRSGGTVPGPSEHLNAARPGASSGSTTDHIPAPLFETLPDVPDVEVGSGHASDNRYEQALAGLRQTTGSPDASVFSAIKGATNSWQKFVDVRPAASTPREKSEAVQVESADDAEQSQPRPDPWARHYGDSILSDRGRNGRPRWRPAGTTGGVAVRGAAP